MLFFQLLSSTQWNAIFSPDVNIAIQNKSGCRPVRCHLKSSLLSMQAMSGVCWLAMTGEAVWLVTLLASTQTWWRNSFWLTSLISRPLSIICGNLGTRNTSYGETGDVCAAGAREKIMIWHTHLLTHRGRDKTVVILQTTFSNAFFGIKMIVFPLEFVCNCPVNNKLAFII